MNLCSAMKDQTGLFLGEHWSFGLEMSLDAQNVIRYHGKLKDHPKQCSHGILACENLKRSLRVPAKRLEATGYLYNILS